MNDTKIACRLCIAIHQGTAKSEAVACCNTVLYRTKHFVIIPAIGPIVVGHALLASTSHHRSLATMPREALTEYTEVIAHLLSLRLVNGDLLQVEHGPANDCTAGACIAHTHVHLLPGMTASEKIFAEHLPRAKIVDHIAQLPLITDPYLLVRPGNSGFSLYPAEDLPSQGFRRILCASLGQPDWDWRTSPRNEQILQSVQFWREAIHA